MPTYTSSNTLVVYSGEPYVRLEPGETVTDKYIKDLPSNVILTDHEPYAQPWVLVEADDDDLYQVYMHDNICVYNASDDMATISANTDDVNAYPVEAGQVQIFSNQERLFGCLAVLTQGTGTIYIYGVR